MNCAPCAPRGCVGPNYPDLFPSGPTGPTTIYWNVSQTATCPAGTIGTSVTVPAHTFFSSISQADADAKAMASALAQLICGTVFWNVEQTATCPVGATGTPVTIAAHTFQAASQAEADALALAAAQSALSCCGSTDPLPFTPDYSALQPAVANAQLDQYGLNGFPDFREWLAASGQSEANWLICPTFDFCTGPVTEGSTTPIPYATRWGAYYDVVTGLIMYGLVGGTFVQADAALFPAPFILPTNGQISIGFDANARAGFAFQFDATTVHLRRFVAGTPTTFTWAGTYPRLWYDGILQRDNWRTDLVCFYVNATGQVCARMERDNFATEYLMIAPPTAVARLTKVDQWQSRETLYFIDALTKRRMSQSALYPPFPTQVSDLGGVRTGGLSGEYSLVAIPSGPYSEIGALRTGNLTGDYFLVTVAGDTVVETGGLTTGAMTGAYSQVVVAGDTVGETGGLRTGALSGDYFLGVVDGGTYAEGTGLVTGNLTGSYS